MSTKTRATLKELKEFADKVREAGGGNPLDALMPSVPGDSQQCLIAKNLNFNCHVDAEGPNGQWVMGIEDEETVTAIAKKLELAIYSDDYTYGVILPPEIGEVAATFDKVDTVLRSEDREQSAFEEGITAEDIQEFLPFIEESKKEAYRLAEIINEDGSIVL